MQLSKNKLELILLSFLKKGKENIIKETQVFFSLLIRIYFLQGSRQYITVLRINKIEHVLENDANGVSLI